MSDETRNKLISALRQFRHNNDNTGSITRPEQGFVFAYDRDETEGLVASLEKKLEQAEARCAELHQAAYPLYSWCAEHLTYQQFNEAYNYGHYLGMVIEKHNPAVGAIILRKQAEAVDAAVSALMPSAYGAPDDPPPEYNAACEMCADFRDYANRLRQQATEIESGGSDG